MATKYIVTMNGVNAVEFCSTKWANPEKMAQEYVSMQRRSQKGAGLAKTIPEDMKKSFAAKQNWEIKVVEA